MPAQSDPVLLVTGGSRSIGAATARAGTATEVAETIVRLLSDAASFVTGTCADISSGG